MTTLVHYEGQIAATVGATRFYLSAELADLPSGDPHVRFVVLMCTYALEVAQERLPGPYTDDRAALFARSALLDDDEFRRHIARPDAELAQTFGVPAGQVAAKRIDLAGGPR